MSMFFRSWLEEGYYSEDSSGDLTKLTDTKDINEARKSGTLYERDGYSMNKVDDGNDIDINQYEQPKKFKSYG